MVDVLFRVPDEALRAKVPVALFTLGGLLAGITGNGIDLLVSLILLVASGFFAVASYYYWLRPISLWTVIAWAIAIGLISTILSEMSSILTSFIDALLFQIFLFPTVDLFSSTFGIIAGVLIAAYVTYLTAYVLFTKTLAFRLNGSVFEAILTIAIASWMLIIFIFEPIINLLEPVLTATGAQIIWAIVQTALSTILLLSALAAFRRDASLREMVDSDASSEPSGETATDV